MKQIQIQFESIGFAYQPDRPILQDVSFTVEPGQKCAIVGESGAGKSTLAKLLFRFYDVSQGSIKVDNIDLRGIAQGDLRRLFGVVPQDTVLFNDTIEYNIAYGRPGAAFEAIQDAARRAHLLDFIESLPNGWQTKVGERGLKVSGGEKQRIAIARVLLKDPPILIFDEATSALDTEAEQRISHELDGLADRHTSIVIAHRLSTVVNADKIIVLSKGRIVEEGSHKDLLKHAGVYHGLWESQNT